MCLLYQKTSAREVVMLMCVKVQPKNNLHFLVEEMERWRGIIGDKYTLYKQGKLKQSLW